MPELDFIRQDGEPLYPKTLWNRPVSRVGAGRLLIPGGHSGDMSLPTAIYQAAMASGAGECVVALPDVLTKLLGGTPATTFVASSPSGSLGREALGRLLELSEEADAVLIGASLSNNSHTTILVEKFLQEANRPTVIFGEGILALQHHPGFITQNQSSLIIATMPEMFKLAGSLQIPIHIRRDGGLLNKLEIVHTIAEQSNCAYVVYGTEIIVCVNSELIVTPINYQLSQLPAIYYGVMSTFWVQNIKRPIEGLATAAYVLREAAGAIGSEGRPSLNALTAAIKTVLETTAIT